MPKQEVFFEQVAAGRRIEVLKVYDEQYAREAFGRMGEDAQTHLWKSLKPEELYDSVGLPGTDEPLEREAFLWDELVDQAREDWKTFSYFVVNETTGNRSESLYVSPDWPSAEEFAKKRLSAIQ